MEELQGIFKKLELQSLERHLPGTSLGENVELSEPEVRKLIGWASLLSTSDEPDEHLLSFDVITRLLEISNNDSQGVFQSAEVILSRLGNFPCRELLRQRYAFNQEQVSPFLTLEGYVREVENTVFIGDEEEIQLTNFQYKFYRSMMSERSFSISAPTSAGKSFVLGLSLIEKLRGASGQTIVYLVPTRALISEVSGRIRDSFRQQKLENVVVRTGPFPLSDRHKGVNAVFVFTQERLMSYLSSDELNSEISVLVVDEAHEIQKGKRGIILQNAIDRVLSRSAKASVLFASPLIRNPAYFLKLFKRDASGKYWVEKISPVLKNIILVSEVCKKPKHLNFQLLGSNEPTELGTREVNFRFRGSKFKQQAEFAAAISRNEDSVIIFSNYPNDAERVATELSNSIESFEPHEEVEAFIEFLRSEIHSEYPLIECLKKGVAFHYGHMPSIVRTGVESLFKDGLINYICCTSTLLQGVNLPAKHIIIENPHSGDDPMTRADFQNLAGRAGRLLKEFHGYVWCIRPREWDTPSFTGEELQEIESAMGSVMHDGGVLIQKAIENGMGDDSNRELAEVAFGKLYHDLISSHTSPNAEEYRSEMNSEMLDKTLIQVSSIEVTLPLELVEKNKALRPDHLQGLYNELVSKTDLSEFAPMSPFIKGGKARMDEIFNLLLSSFDWKLHENYVPWVSLLAYQWVRGETIGKILRERVSYVKNNRPTETTSSIIRNCLRTLETDIRFNLVRYFSAYLDVLKHVCQGRECHVDVEPYHIYLEFGACNWDALNLMALGMSRFTGLYLVSKLKFNLDSEADAEDYLKVLRNIDFSKIEMPLLCRKEAEAMAGIKS